jgi:UDP-glucose:(heptosyl)LPS alpha-1,3-glucosyltransferase
MKLGFLLFDYFPFGGLQRDCLKVAKVCAARGHEITIFTRTWQGERPPELRVELFGRHGFSNVNRNRHWISQLAKILPQHNLQGVIGFNKLPGLDVYYGSDPCYAAKVNRLKPFWYRWLARYRHFAGLEKSVFQRGAKTQILLLTPHEIPAYQKFYGTEQERFHLLPPGISRVEFSREKQQAARQKIRSAHGWNELNYLLLFVGSGFRVKGLERVIHGLAALPGEIRKRTQLAVIGQNRPGIFAARAKRLGVSENVHFLGGRNDVPEWLLAADLLVHPAHSESAGMILLEAMTAGLPILTTASCGYAFHIENANAGIVLSQPFDQSAFNRRLDEMLRSPEREKWKNGGLSYAATQDLYSCHERAADIIEETIRAKKI